MCCSQMSARVQLVDLSLMHHWQKQHAAEVCSCSSDSLLGEHDTCYNRPAAYLHGRCQPLHHCINVVLLAVILHLAELILHRVKSR